MATKQQQLTISISTINDTDYFGKDISIYFFEVKTSLDAPHTFYSRAVN
jgi:hypothetical protein